MYKNQYLVTSSRHTPAFSLEDSGLRAVAFDGLRIYVHADLNVVTSSSNVSAVALLGELIDPANPDHGNQHLADRLAADCWTLDDLIQHTLPLCGRYVLLYKQDARFVVVGDTCHLRQIYFGRVNDAPVITSSPRLFLDFFRFSLTVDPETLAIHRSPLFKAEESAWLGEKTPVRQLKRLLPNHCLDLQTLNAKRLPVAEMPRPAGEDTVAAYACAVLQGTFAAMTSRYRLLQPLTAGLDSRLLLAASKAYRDRIQYYVCGDASSDADDIQVPTRLSRRLGLPFRILQPEPLRDDFLAAYQREQILPRLLPKTSNIQSHYDQTYAPDVINVNGNCAEVARCKYGYTATRITLDMLLTYSGYGRRFPAFNRQLAAWLPGASRYARQLRIPVCDLLYWEQRMGIWGAMYPFEQDIAVEEISPFNNRALLLALLALDPKTRRAPSYSFFVEVIRHLWPEVLSEPINPSKSRLRGMIKARGMLLYLTLKARQLRR